MFFVVGDYAVGMLVGALTAAGVHVIVWPGMDMVVAMFLGMTAGMVVSTVLGLLIMPVLGMFQTMLPAMMIGMLGGMLFGMRDSMGAGSGSVPGTVGVGVLFGAIVVLGVAAYQKMLQGVVIGDGK